MRFYSLQNLINFISFKRYRFASSWIWSDFVHSSTFQLSSFLEVLIEPLDSNKIDHDKIKLGLHEALVNAVKHGNLNDNSKELRVRRIITNNWFVWQIKDEGQGIPKAYRNFSLPNNLDAESGRGLYIIFQCFDDVRWTAKGNKLQVACKRNNK